MNHKQKMRLTGIVSVIVILCGAAGLILYALKQNINLFYTPTEVLTANIHPNQIIRIGGYVKKKRIHFDKTGTTVRFVITDKKNEMTIDYQGVLPNLFREGQGVVVTGKLTPAHTLLASEVLAKHDEKYMPWPLSKKMDASNTV